MVKKIDKKVNVCGLDQLIIQIDDRHDDGNLGPVENSVTEPVYGVIVCV